MESDDYIRFYSFANPSYSTVVRYITSQSSIWLTLLRLKKYTVVRLCYYLNSNRIIVFPKPICYNSRCCLKTNLKWQQSLINKSLSYNGYISFGTSKLYTANFIFLPIFAHGVNKLFAFIGILLIVIILPEK